MEISLPSTGASGGASERPIEGRVESIKDGVAAVRISGNQVVDATLDSDVPVGSKVVLSVGSDGKLSARAPARVAVEARMAMLELLMESMPEIAGTSKVDDLARSLAKGDLEGARRQIAGIWNEANEVAPERLASAQREWLERRAPPLLSRSGEAPELSGSVALVLGSPKDAPGEYAALLAGRSATLLGPEALDPGPKGLWSARKIPGVGAVWAPVGTLRSEEVDRELPERISADRDGAKALLGWAGVEAGPGDEESLGRLLQDVARRFAAAGRAASGADPGKDSDRLSESVQARGTDMERRRKTESVFATGGGADPAEEGIRRDEAEPRVELPRSVARRALVAWSLELPDDPAVRAAVVGEAPDLPRALHEVERILKTLHGSDFPVLSGLLDAARSTDRMDAAGMRARGSDAVSREALSEAVFDALSRTGAEAEHAPLRDALRQAAASLVQEALEPPKDRSAEGSPPGVFHVRGREGGMEEGRIVVHDRRARKGSGAEAADHHFVEIEMQPRELGAIKARLELRGRNLTTRIEAKDPATAAMIEERSAELREAFRKIGLEPAAIRVERPARERSTGVGRVRGGGALDLRA